MSTPRTIALCVFRPPVYDGAIFEIEPGKRNAIGAGVAWRGNLWAQLESLPSKLPDRSLFDQNEDAYWRELRKQFLIPADEIYLNNGTVGSSPAPVLRAVFEGYERAKNSTRTIPRTIRSGDMRRGTSFAIRWPRL